MAMMDTRIPLAIRQPNTVNALAGGIQAAGMANQVGQQNALRQLYAEQGPGISAGEQNALNALSRLDPGQARGIRESEERLKLARAAGARAAAAAARDDKQRKQLEQEFAVLRQGAMAYEKAQNGDPSAFEQWSGISGVTMDDFPVYLATAQGGMEMLQRLSAGQAYGQPAAPDSEGEREIARLMELGYSREEAIRIKELYRVDRDPTTREAQVINMGTGEIVGGRPQNAGQQGQPALSFGQNQTQGAEDVPYSAADRSFGAMGYLRRIGNTLLDTAGYGAPWPDVQQTQADFAVLKEDLTNRIAEAYGRQPPSWLMQNISALAPEAGTFFQGPSAAQTKLKALRRDFERESANTARALASRALSPTARGEYEARLAGIESALSIINAALGGFSQKTYEGQSDDEALMQELLGGG